jgi:hypothetical protein
MPRGLTGYPFKEFGHGLNLRSKPDNVDAASCIDCMNVIFSDRGAIEQRDGYDNLTAALTNSVDSLEPFYTSSGTKQLLAGCGTRLEAISTAGAVVASATGLSGGPYDFVRYGKPNEEVAFAGNGTDTIRKWSGAAWTAPTATVNGEAAKAMPKARYLAVQSPDNRLVATGFATTTGGPAGATSSPSHVYWSEPGNPEEWKTAGTEANPNNSIQLTPGDGEAIQGAIVWRELLFVFKESKFFVFYGNSTDSVGNPVFNYRPVATGVGLASPRTLCADRNGVYFMGRQGVYRTTGQEPELISKSIEPIWTGDASTFYTGGTLATGSITNCAATIHNERLYLSFPTESANNRTLVYDPRYEWWSLYSLPCSALASFRIGSAPELVFGYASGLNEIGRHGPSFTNDDGTAISSRWRSGWFDLELPDVKTLVRSKVWGTGIVRMSLGRDFQQDSGTQAPLELVDKAAPSWGGQNWGTFNWASPMVLISKARRRAVRGTTFSVYLSNELMDQEWSIHRVDHLLREVRNPSTTTA